MSWGDEFLGYSYFTLNRAAAKWAKRPFWKISPTISRLAPPCRRDLKRYRGAISPIRRLDCAAVQIQF
jgi:hypothetical protein